MKRFLLLLTFIALVGAQTPSTRSCGLSGDHPCHCLTHVQKIQDEAMKACLLGRSGEKPTEDLIYCMRQMPQHCLIVEHYGNWGIGEDGEHSNPMPEQCTSACKWGHCSCADGGKCHFSHSAEEDKQK